MSRFVKLAVAVWLAAAGPAAASTTPAITPSAVLRGAWTLDQTRVTVTGRLAQAHQWTSSSGRLYSRFTLTEGRAAVPVLFRGHAPCENGSETTVEGVFRRLFVVDGQVLERVVEATNVDCAAGQGSVDHAPRR